jgi:hypothetical protein
MSQSGLGDEFNALTDLLSELEILPAGKDPSPTAASTVVPFTPLRSGTVHQGTLGGRSKPACIVVVDHENACLHLIGKGGTCVCIKEQKLGESNCGVNHQGNWLAIKGETLLVHRSY